MLFYTITQGFNVTGRQISWKMHYEPLAKVALRILPI